MENLPMSASDHYAILKIKGGMATLIGTSKSLESARNYCLTMAINDPSFTYQIAEFTDYLVYMPPKKHHGTKVWRSEQSGLIRRILEWTGCY